MEEKQTRICPWCNTRVDNPCKFNERLTCRYWLKDPIYWLIAVVIGLYLLTTMFGCTNPYDKFKPKVEQYQEIKQAPTNPVIPKEVYWFGALTVLYIYGKKWARGEIRFRIWKQMRIKVDQPDNTGKTRIPALGEKELQQDEKHKVIDIVQQFNDEQTDTRSRDYVHVREGEPKPKKGKKKPRW